jgi:hypothetical protein
MKNEITFIVEDAIEGGYTAHALGENIITEADTIDELRRWFVMLSTAILRLIKNRKSFIYILPAMKS